MQCPICGKTFRFSEAKNKTYDLKSSLNCPYCNKRLQNPEHLRTHSLYLKFIVASLAYMTAFFYLIIQYQKVGFLVSLPFMVLLLFWIKKGMKLKKGYIQLVEVNNVKRCRRD